MSDALQVVAFVSPFVVASAVAVGYQLTLNRVMRRRERDLAPNPPGWDRAVQGFADDLDMPVEELEVQWNEGSRCGQCGRIVRLSRARRLRRAWVNHATTCPARGKRPRPLELTHGR